MSPRPSLADLNDRFRSRLGVPTFGDEVPGQFVFTRGIQGLPPEVQIELWRAVRMFDGFTEDSDPYGEHDFGSIDHPAAGRVFWKIDYYDRTYSAGTEDPCDLAQTRRDLTLMLAEEY